MDHAKERVTTSVACEVEIMHTPEVVGGNFEQYYEGVATSVARKGDPTKTGCLTFDPGGMSTINWRKTGVQV